MSLFVGGPLDGQHVEIESTRSFFVVALPPKINLQQVIHGEQAMNYTDIVKFAYKREKLRCPGTDYDIFVPEDFSCDDLIKALITGYKNNS